MQQRQIVKLNDDITQEQKHPLIVLQEAISNLQSLFNSNTNQQQHQNQNPQQQINVQGQVHLNKNQDELPIQIFSHFSDSKSNPSSLITNISTITEYKQKFDEYFQYLLKAQQLIILEWDKLQSQDEKYNKQDEQEIFQKTKKLLEKLLSEIPLSTNPRQSQNNQDENYYELQQRQKVSITVGQLREIDISYRSLLQKLKQQQSKEKVKKQETFLQEQDKNKIKQDFKSFLQEISDTIYQENEAITRDGKITHSQAKNQKYKKKQQNQQVDFQNIPTNLEENVQQRFLKFLDRTKLSKYYAFNIVFPLFEKVDEIQRLLEKIFRLESQKKIDSLEMEIDNCIIKMKKQFKIDLNSSILCLRFSKLHIKEMNALYKKIEEIDYRKQHK